MSTCIDDGKNMFLDKMPVWKNAADWKWLHTTVVYQENCNDSENWRIFSQGKVLLPDMSCW